MKEVSELVGLGLTVQGLAKKAHWSTKSYSQHKALGSYYDDLSDLIDTLVEQSQADKLLKIPNYTVTDAGDFIVREIESFCAACKAVYMKAEKEKYFDVSNTIAEIMTLNYQTLYKLKNLA